MFDAVATLVETGTAEITVYYFIAGLIFSTETYFAVCFEKIGLLF